MDTVWNPHHDGLVRGHELCKDRFWGRLITEVGRAAASVSANEYERDDNIRRGLSVVDSAVRAVNPDWWSRGEHGDVRPWWHQSRPILAGKKHGEPYIARLEAEGAAAEYLDLGFRADGLDRLLTDMLLAAEMFAFADEMQPQFKQKLPPVISWLWNNLKSLAIGMSIAGIIAWLAPNSTVLLWIAGIIAGVTVLGVALSLVLFPFFYSTISTQRKKFKATVMSMIDAYTTLDGSPASVPHVRKFVDRATDVGVVWPAPLMALLDDIADRRKMI